MRHTIHQHKHPALAVSLQTRTRLLGTVNVAIAIRGKSCGWGTCDRPRRTFLGLMKRAKNDTGLHFIELAVLRGAMREDRVLFRIGDPCPSLVHEIGSGG